MNKKLVRFHGLCDGKRKVRKKVLLGFCVERSSFLRKTRPLLPTCKYLWCTTCRPWKGGFLVHGKSKVRFVKLYGAGN